MTWIIAFWAVLVLAIALAIRLVKASSRCQTAEREHDRLRTDLEDSRTHNESLTTTLHRLEQDIVRFKTQHEALEQRMADQKADFEIAQKLARETFDALAGNALKDVSKQFFTMAREAFDERQKSGAKAIESLVNPVKESLDKHKELVQKVETSLKQDYGALGSQVRRMIEDNQKLRQSTDNLVGALRRPGVRGRWGEMQLKRVVELAGMENHCDFREQVSTTSDDGTLKPDMLIHLPNDRVIVVDAKVSWQGFWNAQNAEDEVARENGLKDHVNQVNQHVRALSNKRYSEQFSQSPEFVVMFLPTESFFYAAAQRQPDLIDAALGKGIVIATPTTLVSLLKVVAMGWQEKILAENARQIGEVGKELHERLAVVAGHIQSLGDKLNKSVVQYDSLVGSFQTRLVVSAKKLEDLGAKSSKDLLDDLSPIGRTTRPLNLIDSSASTPPIPDP